VGLIGLGYWGPNHARVISELPETELVAVADISEQAIRLVHGRYPAVRTTHDAREVIEAPDIDAVIIAIGGGGLCAGLGVVYVVLGSIALRNFERLARDRATLSLT